MIIKEDTNITTIINQLKKISVEISEIGVNLDDSNIDRNSKEGKQIAQLLSDIYWKLDYLEDDGYFDR